MSRESLEELRERLLRQEHAQELIRMRAFEIYKLRGGQPGGEAHDWFQAESEVLTFLIEEESGRALDLQHENAASKAGEAEPAKPAKRAAPKQTGARKTKQQAAEKPAPKSSSKKPAGSASKPRGKGTKD
ncbi:MAG: DUF2934 domain-containing protein [Acidobacteriota bacterium]